MFMDPKLIHKNSLNIDIVRENRMARQKAKMDEALLSNQNDAATILIRCLQRARQRRIAHDLVREYWDEEIKCLFDLKREPKTQTRLIYLLIRFYDASRDYQRIKHLCSRLLKRDTSNSLFHQLLLSSKNPNDEIKRCALRVVPSFLELVTRGIVGSLCPLSKRIELRLLVAYSDIKLDTFSLKNKINGFLLDSQFNETIAPHLIASIRRLSSTRVSKESHEEKSHLEAYIKGTLFLNLSSTASVSEDVEIEHAILTTILTIPLLSDFLDAQGLRLLSTSFWKQCLKDLSGKLFMSINGEQALFILANFVTFLTKTSAFQADDAAMRDVHIPLIHVLLLICEQFVSESGNGRYVTYHRFFKWYAGKPTDLTDDESNLLFIQLSSLWSRECITCVFGSITYIPIPVEVMDYRLQKKSNSLSRDRLKKMSSLSLLRRRSSVISVKSVSTVNKAETDSNTTLVTSSDTDQHYAAALFPLMMRVFRVQEQSISSALAYTPGTTSKMWQLLTGIYSTTHEMVSHIASQTVKGKRTVVMEMFELFCRSGILLFSTLDDREVYEEERPFRLAELVDMLNFFNQLCYEICLDNSAFTSNTTQSVFVIARKLLLILEEMNSRRSFGHTVWRPQVSWHAVSSRIENRDQEALRILHQMPHLIPFSVRVQVFRMLIKEDQIRVADNRIKTVFKIHRNRIIEDGFRVFSRISNNDLKNAVKIAFISTLGYEEAGIDQRGVFKEFLEETCKKAFASELNFFQRNCDGRISISSSSHIQENHLQYFYYFGRVLGKALYEGTILDIHFALFIYSKFLGRYNYLEDLPFLDPDVYKNLIFLKNYTGNAADLGLTFTVDEDVFGSVTTKEIKPGGAHIYVTDENKLEYVFLVADYKLNQQSRMCYDALLQGFKCLIPTEWLQLFSPKELKILMCGDDNSYNIKDLMKNTEYEGGYSLDHPVIRNLWSVLGDFAHKDRAAFLKFVTSCSKSPVGGFRHMSPKFTIRLSTEPTSDGSLSKWKSIWKLLSMKEETDRLPTASTCFNILKLPPYKSRKRLREKLLYAIHSGSGFELS